MLRGFEPRTPSRAAKCSAASRHPAPVCDSGLNAGDEGKGTGHPRDGHCRRGAFSHRVHQHPTRRDDVTGGSRESLTGRQPSAPREEFAQPPGTATSVREPSHHLPQPDLLFLNEPAPGLDQLAVHPGRVVVIVFGAPGLRCAPHRRRAARALLGPGTGVALRHDDQHRVHRSWLRCGRRCRAATLSDPRLCDRRARRADPAPHQRP